VPFAPGGVSDVTARLIAKDLGNAIGQSFVVDNKPGAQGVLGSMLAKQAAPDGYTLVLMSSSVACVNPYLRKSFPFSALNDFAPVGMIGSAPLMMLVPPKLGVRTLPEFLAYAKANPGKINYSTPGVGGSAHLTCTARCSTTCSAWACFMSLTRAAPRPSRQCSRAKPT
jgi:tripartite-type tricarboxylate transporter receptor subunit TctC